MKKICSHCNRVWLKRTSKGARAKCCFNGKAKNELSCWPKLSPIDTRIIDVIFGGSNVAFINANGETDFTHNLNNNIAHMSRNSAQYNGVLSISATGVDNGKKGGWEKIHGAHAGKVSMYFF
jgi:hypothetical protein